MEVDGRERSYIVHVPPHATTAESLPLLIVLHGSYGTGRKMQIGLGFDAYADTKGFLVAYPDAYQGGRWNDGRGTLESTQRGVDDVAFLTQLIDTIDANTSVDRRRVYVTGASNGGMMTYRLGCETQGIFAGFAPVIANLPEPIAASCTPQAPLNLLAINGDADPFIPFAGGEVCEKVRIGCEKGFVLSAADSLQRFAQANGCSLIAQVEAWPILVDDGTSIERQNYANCTNGAQVQLYVMKGGGHVWAPRTSQIASGGKTTGNLDATRLIVEFFFGAS